MNDESGESMEPMEEVPLIQLGEAELECVVDGGEPGVDSRDEGSILEGTICYSQRR